MDIKNNDVYDFIGIGIGPFNLGLAALTQPIADCKSIFFDRQEQFNWHLGLMLDDATLQVPFMADLVTMADPSSPYSFLNYIKQTGKIYKFYIRENFFILRREYNAYCQWVVNQLEQCKFGHEVLDIVYIDPIYQITVRNKGTQETNQYMTKKIVLGTGTEPFIPKFLKNRDLPNLLHTSSYLYRKDELTQKTTVTVVGSGQSAAEIVRDLLPLTRTGLHLNWITRSERFFPLENHARLTLEMTSPEYVDYFYSLPSSKRDQLLKEQSILYKGINYELINEIFNALYNMEAADGKVNVTLIANSELQDLTVQNHGSYQLNFRLKEQDKDYAIASDFVIMATGYKYNEPTFLSHIQDRIARTDTGAFQVQRNYTIDKNQQEIFVQNAELQTHGIATPDLGMGAYRNSYILREILGREVYPVEQKIAFQSFGIEERFSSTPSFKNTESGIAEALVEKS
ncbi:MULTISPECIES: lysine N(6)-hydroxylase/L-ornithine N(5)-oxygenase family protein [unclassified Sphingobacterium]|uniref:lysine N(6)-hydroxylase/L-ornithine N(5)-oxygenase family protein n=1 Tax=unclassified Sphingobacterium TaxID=2609468 RepID=UPI001046F2AD|nr:MULTISPECIES: SidA/IucD/PvdA family monooxygenase [unclassified Sphingobacterium]MCS3556583.1 lysine N6-hydroxylase [Sphingobacterium sp. JUb21]TCQ99877.1 lysine N6-hydroxylase [Sphingobacterium sp. JUb20]